MTDAELIQCYLQGNMHAFNQLVWRWQKPIYNFILKTVANEEVAKDICQVVFVKVYQQVKGLKDQESFSPWIYRIAYRVCCDEFKRNKKCRTISLDEQASENGQLLVRQMPGQGQNPEQQVETQEIQKILENALNTLPEEQRVVVIMKQYQGMKFREIAEALDEPVNTVKSRLYYGLKALKKMLEASELSEEVLLYDV